jgi:hypothetical protein
MGIQIITLEGQTIQWSKEKGQKGKQRSTKHTHKTKDRVTRTPLKTGSEFRCSERVSSSCSTSGTHCINLIDSNCWVLRETRKVETNHFLSVSKQII